MRAREIVQEGLSMEIKITRASTLKEKPDSSTLVFGKAMTDHMFYYSSIFVLVKGQATAFCACTSRSDLI